MSNIYSSEARRSARNLYGKEMGTLLIDTAGEWHELASAELDLAPTDCHIEFQSDFPAWGYYNPAQKTVNLVVPTVIPSDYIEDIPDILIHENTHRKRATVKHHMPKATNFRNYAFERFIDEGLAVHAPLELFNRPPLNYSAEVDTADKKWFDGLLLDALYYTNIFHPRSIHKAENYFYGDRGGVEDRCYRVGYYIVSRACLLNNVALNEALELPDAFYYEFAEEYL